LWLYSKLSYTQANFIVWYHQLIWTIYKIKCSKNIQELKTQANFRVWEIWVFVLPRCGYKKGTMTIAFIPSFHDVLPMCSVFQTCQTVAASSRVWLLWTLVISRLLIQITLSAWRSGLLVYKVISIVVPNRLGTGSTWAGSTWAGTTCAEMTWGRNDLIPQKRPLRLHKR
jgi:hypothetical protein